MNIHDQQEQEERAVFDEFANVCSALPLVPETARPGADPPDVLCDLTSGETLAFELVSCEDVTKDDAHPDGYSAIMPKRLKDAMEFKNVLDQAYSESLAKRRIVEPERSNFHSVRVNLEDGFPSKNRRQKVARRMIGLLNKKGPGVHTINDGVIRSIHCERDPENLQIEGPPTFHVRSGCGARPYVVERIIEKIVKSEGYKSDFAIHLLAWSTTACHAESVLWRDRLTNLLQSNGMGQFERIWVFGVCDQSIVFDSRANSAG